MHLHELSHVPRRLGRVVPQSLQKLGQSFLRELAASSLEFGEAGQPESRIEVVVGGVEGPPDHGHCRRSAGGYLLLLHVLLLLLLVLILLLGLLPHDELLLEVHAGGNNKWMTDSATFTLKANSIVVYLSLLSSPFHSTPPAYSFSTASALLFGSLCCCCCTYYGTY